MQECSLYQLLNIRNEGNVPFYIFVDNTYKNTPFTSIAKHRLYQLLNIENGGNVPFYIFVDNTYKTRQSHPLHILIPGQVVVKCGEAPWIMHEQQYSTPPTGTSITTSRPWTLR